MQDFATAPAIAGFLVAATLYGGFAIWLTIGFVARGNGNFPAGTFLAAVVASAAWAVLAALAGLYDPPWLAPLATLSDIARYGLWMLFLLLLMRPAPPERVLPETRVLALVAMVVLVFSGAMRTLAVADELDTGLMRLAQFGALALPLLGLILIEQLFRNLPDPSRWNAKPLCLGLGVVFAFDLYLYSEAVLFGRFDRDAVSVRGAIHSLAVPLLFITSRRHANWIGKLQVSRSAAFYSATLLLSGIYLLLISGIGYYIRYFGGSWGRALQLAVLVAAAVLLTLMVFSGSLRAKVRVLVSKNFFSYRYDYREEWLRFTDTLSTRSSPQEMGQLVVRGLADLVESPGGLLWSRTLEDPGLLQPSARWNLPAVDVALPVSSVFAKFLAERSWIVDVEEAQRHPNRYPGLELPTALAQAAGSQAWLIVPLVVADEMTGFVMLARPRATLELDWEVRDLLKTASRQAAGILAQMQATEALLEARKFDAFNRMSAFVVHDLKNIVTQLTLMLKNAKRLHDNPEFQQDMLITVENSLEKMRQLMVQLREGEKPAGSLAGVDLVATAQRIAEVAAQRGRSVELELRERVWTRGHEQRVERVLGHVVQNALDATPASGRVWLKVTRAAGQAHIEVGDTGQGMTSEFVDHELFRPFRSTKSGGMGIGSYESRQYVRELGGRISVDSAPGRGTTVLIELPLFEARQDSDLQLADAR